MERHFTIPTESTLPLLKQQANDVRWLKIRTDQYRGDSTMALVVRQLLADSLQENPSRFLLQVLSLYIRAKTPLMSAANLGTAL